MLHPAVALIFCRPFLLLVSPDLFLPPTFPAHPTVSPGTATKAANGEGMYLHTVTDGEIQREREGEGQRGTQAKRERERETEGLKQEEEAQCCMVRSGKREVKSS